MTANKKYWETKTSRKHCTFLTDDIQYNSVNASKGGLFTCSMSVFVHTDPSEKATFSLLNTSPVKEDDIVTMKCETDGNPQPEFEFTKDVRMHFMCICFSTFVLCMR